MDQEGTCVPVSYTNEGSSTRERLAFTQLLLIQNPRDTSGLNNTLAIALLLTFPYSYVSPPLKVAITFCANKSTLSDSIAADVRAGTSINMLNIIDKLNKWDVISQCLGRELNPTYTNQTNNHPSGNSYVSDIPVALSVCLTNQSKFF